MELVEGQRVGNYEVIGRLGAGAMATVYKVRHLQLQAEYALKLLDQVGGRMQERLLQEGRVQAQLRHPNIVAVTDVVEVDGQPGLVMELVEGPTLSQHLRARHPLAFDELDGLVKPILRGVRAAHRLGHVHRDLKPANVLLARLDDEWVPKIADFGLVKALGVATTTTQTRSGAILGSPAYMAPEQTLSSRAVDERADVWALGAMLYQMVTGKLPFEDDDFVAVFAKVRVGRFTEPRQLRPDLPERMRAAILGAMTVDPDARIRDCDELLAVWEGKSARRIAPVDSTETLTAGVFNSGQTPAFVEQSSGSLETMATALDGTGPRVSVRLGDEPAPKPAPPSPTDSLAPALASLAVGERPAASPGAGSRLGLLLFASAAGALALLAVGVGVGAWVAQRAVSPLPEAPAPVPAAPAPVELAPVEAAPPAPTVVPEVEPAAPAPLPARPAPRVEAPKPALSEAPSPSSPVSPGTAEPTAPAPPEAPAPAAAPALEPGRFEATGQAEAVWLVRGGVYHPPGAVEPGTYTVSARFPGRPAAPVEGLVVEVRPGQSVTLACVAGFLTCKAQ